MSQYVGCRLSKRLSNSLGSATSFGHSSMASAIKYRSFTFISIYVVLHLLSMFT